MLQHNTHSHCLQQFGGFISRQMSRIFRCQTSVRSRLSNKTRSDLQFTVPHSTDIDYPF